MFKSNMCTWWGAMACLFGLFAARSAAATNQARQPTFEYQPFPSIAATIVTPSNFVAELVQACRVIDDIQLDPACAEPVRNAAGMRPSAALAIEAGHGDRILAAERGEAGSDRQIQRDVRPTSDESRASQVLQSYVSRLKCVCGNIRAGSLAPGDSALLRVVREHADLAKFVIKLSERKAKAESPVVTDQDIARSAATAVEGKLQSGAAASNGITAFGGNLVQGLADFLADRAKQETVRYLQKQLLRELCARQTQAFFTNTCAVLKSTDTDVPLGSIAAYFRSAVESDLELMPDVMLDYADFVDAKLKGPVWAARIFVEFSKEASSGRDPFELAYSAGEIRTPACDKGDSLCTTMVSSLQLASAIAYALAQGGAEWPSYYQELDAKDWGVAAVAVLLLAESRWGKTTNPSNTIPDVALNQLMMRPGAMWAAAMQIRVRWSAMTNALNSSKSDLSQQERRARIFGAITESAGDLVNMIDVALPAVQSKLTLSQEALVEARRHLSRLRTFAAMVSSLSERDYGKAMVMLVQQIREIRKGERLPRNLDKYLPFLVEIASAKSSNDVAAAFDAYAAPLGSYAAKYRRVVWAINAFVGAFAGRERIRSEGVHGTSWMAAGFAPVGLHVSSPLGSTGSDNRLHVGTLISILDLGALTTYRFKQELSGTLNDGSAPADQGTTAEASTAPETGFKQLFAPGLFAVVGIGGSPFVLGAGASLSPELRNVKQGSSSETLPALRYGAFLGADVPILLLH